MARIKNEKDHFQPTATALSEHSEIDMCEYIYICVPTLKYVFCLIDVCNATDISQGSLIFFLFSCNRGSLFIFFFFNYF